MRSPILLRAGRIGIYGFALFVVYLAGVYLGGILLVVFYALLFVPLFSLIHALITVVALRYNQAFTNDHPSKGEAVGYALSITNECPVPSAAVVARFHRGRSDVGTNTERFQLGPHASRKIEQTVRCPYRGIYTVGLSQLAVWDHLGWIGFTLPVFSRTFYVYPRILYVPVALSGFGTEHAVARSRAAGVEIDVTLYRGLRRPRLDDDARHVSWKKLALLGEPLIKEYDTAAEPAVTICLDTRPVTGSRALALEVEDSLIEATVALTKHYMEREVPVSILMGSSAVEIGPEDEATFARFHAETITIFFRTSAPPSTVYDFHRTETALGEGTVVFVMHTLDPGVLELVEQSDGRRLQAASIITTLALSQDDRRRAVHLQRSLRDRGGELVLIESADVLAQELAQWHAGRS